MIEYTCDEMVYLSCLHHLSVLVYFCRVYGEHLSNTQLLFGLSTSRGLLVFSVVAVFAIGLPVWLRDLVDTISTKAVLNLLTLTMSSLTFSRILGALLVPISTLNEPSQGGGL